MNRHTRFLLAFALLALLPGLALAQQKDEDKDWARFSFYAEKNTKVAKKPAAVLFGDSITRGWAKQDPEWLKSHDFLGRGISGQTTEHMLARFRPDVLELSPDYVVILAGINDIARNNGFIKTENIFKDLVSMVELARHNGIRPILCTLVPAHEIGWRKSLGDPRPSIDSLNAMITEYAAQNGIPVADYHSAMKTPDGAMRPELQKDAVHPNLEGYKVMEEVLEDVFAGIRAAGVPVRVMSYNIRNAGAKDGMNAWKKRRNATVEMLRSEKPDVFGIQEAYPEQEAFILKRCPEYAGFGVGRDDGADKGERMSVFYRRDALELLAGGTWWLSETPDVPSVGWDAKYPRTATWAHLRHKATGRDFFFVNTHLDHRGVEARRKGLEMIVARIGEMSPGAPLVLTGDFNVFPDDDCLAGVNLMLHDARTAAAVTSDKPSFNGFGLMESKIIDYIYYRGFVSAEEFKVVDDTFAGKPYISDHYPIEAILKF